MTVFSDEYGFPRAMVYQLTRLVSQYLSDLGSTGYVAVTASTHTVAAATKTMTVNFAGTCTLTLPTASSNKGRELLVRTITANTVVSNASNVVPLAGGAAGTAILAATAGKWARLISDGTSWQVMAAA